MGPLPVTLLCGYLGAGKTTQLNHLLRHATRRVAVMVNDFGAVQIDADLIAGAAGDVVRLTNGCVCCSMDGDLFRAFERVLALRTELDNLVIEASGVAEPHRLVTLARAEPDLAHQGVVTVICAETFPARLGDPRTASVAEAQVAGANVLIPTRRDLVSDQNWDRSLLIARAISPDANWAEVLDSDTLDLAARHSAATAPRPVQRPVAAHFRSFGSAVADLPAPVDRQRLLDWFAAAPPGLHRAKGFVRLAGESGTTELQYASGELRLLPGTSAAAGLVVLIGPESDFVALKRSLEALADLGATIRARPAR